MIERIKNISTEEWLMFTGLGVLMGLVMDNILWGMLLGFGLVVGWNVFFEK